MLCTKYANTNNKLYNITVARSILSNLPNYSFDVLNNEIFGVDKEGNSNAEGKKTRGRRKKTRRKSRGRNKY